MTPGGRCRLCGASGSLADSLLGKTTYTKRGARKILEREIAHKQRDLGCTLKKAGLTEPDLDIGLHGISWQEAEHFVCDWMKKNGYRDAALTATGADGGIDVSSRKAVAQVKHHSRPVGILEVQRLAGIAVPLKRQALMFAASGYTKPALTWAKSNGVTCFAYAPVRKLT